MLGAKGMPDHLQHMGAGQDHITDCMPEAVRARYGLIPLRDAYYNIHFRSRPSCSGRRSTGSSSTNCWASSSTSSRRTERLSKNNGFCS